MSIVHKGDTMRDSSIFEYPKDELTDVNSPIKADKTAKSPEEIAGIQCGFKYANNSVPNLTSPKGLTGVSSEAFNLPENKNKYSIALKQNDEGYNYVINRYLLPNKLKCGKKMIIESASEIDFKQRYSKQSLALLSFK